MYKILHQGVGLGHVHNEAQLQVIILKALILLIDSNDTQG